MDAIDKTGFSDESSGLVIYTSGTTGPPKGVSLNKDNINAQISCMIDTWGWTSQVLISVRDTI